MDSDSPRGFWSIWPARLVLFFVVLSVTYLGLPGIATAFKSHLAGQDKNLVALVLFGASAILSIAAYRLLVRLTEKRRATELAASGAIPQFLLGALIGSGLFVVVYAVYFAEGVATFRGLGSAQGLGVAFGVGIASGVCEELIARGGIFRIVEQGAGTLVALVVSAATFGALHLANPGASLLAGAAIMLEAGILLAAAYALTRSLWLAIGLHFAWNFTEGGIFGAQVSGGKMSGLLDVPLSGPPLMTGGAFGPEASIPAMVVCTAAGLILLGLAIRKGQWRPMRFRLRTAG